MSLKHTAIELLRGDSSLTARDIRKLARLGDEVSYKALESAVGRARKILGINGRTGRPSNKPRSGEPGSLPKEADRGEMESSINENLGDITKRFSTHKDVTYRADRGEYIVNLRSKGNTIFKESEVVAMIEAYSNFDKSPASVNEVCRRFHLSRADFTELKTKLGLTHDSLPIGPSDLLDKGEEELVDDLMQKKLHAVEQAYKKRQWSEIGLKAKNWDEFVRGRVDPFLDAIQEVRPVEPVRFDVQRNKSASKSTLVVGCFDWQIGESADGRRLHRQVGWSTELASRAIQNWVKKLILDAKQYGVDDVQVIMGGDLNHGFRGKTYKGTELECDTLLEDQFEAVLHAVLTVTSTLAANFKKVHVNCIRGNHEGFHFWPIARAAEIATRSLTNMKWKIEYGYTTRMMIRDVYIVAHHGAHDEFKHAVPKGGKPREAYVQSILLSDKKAISTAKQCFFIQGDKHHFEQTEAADFEFFMFGALPLGDKYADNQNLHSRARQNCLIIDDTGHKATLHYYVDELV